MREARDSLEGLESAAAIERASLARLCAYLTRDPEAAEDLAQETLLEALRNAHKLHDPSGRPRWLAAIARNVCLRWARSQGREISRLVRPGDDDPDLPGLDEVAADDFDLEVELERRELVELLDRALALLPAATRDLLVHRYVHESPHAEIAARLGVSEQAVWMRLNRGKLQLKRVLATELRQEALAYGLAVPETGVWQETRIWCPDCGARKLVGRFAAGQDLHLDCESCARGRRVIQVRGWVAELVWGITSVELLEGVTGYKAALNRMMARTHEFYRHVIAGRTARCPCCGGEAPLRTSLYEVFGYRDIQTDCPHCGRVSGIGTMSAAALGLPAGRAFWRKHERIRTLPGREVEAAGVPTIVATFESASGSARLEVVLARDTLEVLGVHGAPRRL